MLLDRNCINFYSLFESAEKGILETVAHASLTIASTYNPKIQYMGKTMMDSIDYIHLVYNHKHSNNFDMDFLKVVLTCY